MDARNPENSVYTPTTRYLCPLPECDWTHDHKGPPDPVTESVLREHLAGHGMTGMLKGLVAQDAQLRRLREWSRDARLTPPLPSGASDRAEALRTGFIAAAIEVQEILDGE